MAARQVSCSPCRVLIVVLMSSIHIADCQYGGRRVPTTCRLLVCLLKGSSSSAWHSHLADMLLEAYSISSGCCRTAPRLPWHRLIADMLLLACLARSDHCRASLRLLGIIWSLPCFWSPAWHDLITAVVLLACLVSSSRCRASGRGRDASSSRPGRAARRCPCPGGPSWRWDHGPRRTSWSW